MLSNESEFEILLERYDDDPAICSKLLRTHALTEPRVFLKYAHKALLQRPVSRPLKFIAGLATSAGVMESLIELYPQSQTETLALAQKLIACEPRFDVMFLEFLQQPRPAAQEESAFHIGLAILDSISQGDRLVPGALKLLKHPNAKVRSKAALFIGSRTQNLAWTNRGDEYDARVRANILESLYGVNSDFVHHIFRSNVNDENNRVAGNAVLGLYMLGEASSIPIIYDMSRHPDARFRNTCAWIMGRTGDPRFAPVFSELMNDSDDLVRAQAFKGLVELRKSMRASAARPQLKSAVVKAVEGEPLSVLTVVHDLKDQPVRGIRPTNFILKTGTPAKPIREYKLQEHECRSSLSIAFVVCLPAEDEDAVESQFLQTIQRCGELRRPRDRWSVVKLSAKAAPKRMGGSIDVGAGRRTRWSILQIDSEAMADSTPAQDHPGIDYSTQQDRIEAMQREKPLMLGTDADDEAAKLVLSSLLHCDIASGNPHLIFWAAGRRQHLIEALAEKGTDLPATIHVLAHSPEWHSGKARELAERTGGTFRTVSINEIGNACFELYSSLLHHYRIEWSGGADRRIELEISSETGRASASCDFAAADIVPELLTA
jgi:hypothetical protein